MSKHTPGPQTPEKFRLARAAGVRARIVAELPAYHARVSAFRARPGLATITLQMWVDAGRPMLDNHTAAWCCQVAKVNEHALRSMTIAAVMEIPAAGTVAARQFARAAEAGE